MMTVRFLLRCLLLGAGCALFLASPAAAVPALINHQGRIAVNGVNFEGTGQFKFALVDATGATTFWSNNGSSVAGSQPTAAVSLAVAKGLYAVLLGDTALANMTALPTTVFDNNDVRLRVWFNDGAVGFQQITPDQRLAAAPYALVASKVAQVLLSDVLSPPLKPVVAWGNNHDGQTTVPALASVAAIAAGSTQSLALLNTGTVVAWGAGPVVPTGLTNVTHIAAGVAHNLARKSDGTIVAWGSNTFGQTTIPAGITTATNVAGGEKHSLALLADGTVRAWGDNTFPFLQTNVPGGLGNVTAIATGYDHSLALKADGTVVAWGRDDAGQVSGTYPNVGVIVAIIDSTRYKLSRNLAAGTNDLKYNGTTLMSSTSDGTDIVVVGNTSTLAPGMTVSRSYLVGPVGLTNVVAIAAGAYHSLAVKNDGTVVAWGWDAGGQSTVPPGLSGVSKVAGGYAFSMALKTDGTLVTWGDNSDGQTTVPAGTTQVTAIAAGASHVLALRAALIPAQVARLDQDNVFTGKVGIGRTPASNKLEVEGSASKATAGSWLANSDRRIKMEVQPITNALQTLDRVRLVDFRYTDDYRTAHPGIEDRRYLNVIAQEFAEVFPEHVRSSGEKLPDGSEILQVDTYPLTIYSAAAVQELHRENEALNAPK